MEKLQFLIYIIRAEGKPRGYAEEDVMSINGIVYSGTATRKHFTLIELMVVIGIIAILAGMFIPVLLKSKNTARAVYCKNNLKNIVTANLGYASEFKAFVPWGIDYKKSNLTRWHGHRNIASNTAEYNPAEGPLNNYLKSKNFPSCPSFAQFADPNAPSTERGGGGYGYNIYVGTRAYFVENSDSDQAYTSGVFVNEMHNPTETVMFTDSAIPVNSSGTPVTPTTTQPLAEYSISYAPYWVYSKKTDKKIINDPSIHFIHDGTTNTSWGDGHITQEKFKWTIDNAWKNDLLGFLGEHQDNTLYDPF